ncbi:MAG: hypothetical protein K940chlam5_01215 [Candidatus Anoxychlamydiales bacterium]|nr:hypothetical protein [Candidatus Anoxychlamydiales bacterium]
MSTSPTSNYGARAGVSRSSPRRRVVPLHAERSSKVSGDNERRTETEIQRDKGYADWMTFATAVVTIISICGLAHGTIGLMAGHSLTASGVVSGLASAGGSFLGSRLLIFKRDEWKKGNIETSDKITLAALGLLGIVGFALPAIIGAIPKIGALTSAYVGPLTGAGLSTLGLYLWKKDNEARARTNKQIDTERADKREVAEAAKANDIKKTEEIETQIVDSLNNAKGEKEIRTILKYQKNIQKVDIRKFLAEGLLNKISDDKRGVVTKIINELAPDPAAGADSSADSEASSKGVEE